MNNIKLFEQKRIRSYWNEKEEQWYFSIVDIVEALTDSVNPTDYLKKLRKRDAELGSYLGTNCPQVEMLTNGKKRKTWLFSVIDVIEILTGSSIPKRYWSDLKKKLTKEGSQLYENIVQLKFEAADGKKTIHLFKQT